MAFWSKEDETNAREPTATVRTVSAATPPEPKEKKMARDERQTGEINALLGKGATFEGKLTFEGTVRIDGTFKGEIFTDDILVIGEGARVDGEIKAGAVMVNGEVKGNIVASRHVDLHKPARVMGNITTPTIEIEKGVIFEGSCSMKSGGAAVVPGVPKNNAGGNQKQGEVPKAP